MKQKRPQALADGGSPEMVDDVVDGFLRNPGSYGLDPDQLEYIETHISQIYLTPNLVYKRKKPLHLDFLDYHSLEQRHQACLDELHLNRRLAPKTYRRVLPIYYGKQGPSWQESDPESPVIEWLVEMERLPADQFLDQRLRQGLPPGKQEYQDLAQLLKAFFERNRIDHQQLETWLPGLRTRCQSNLNDLCQILPKQAGLIQKISSRQLEFLFFEQRWFEARAKRGLVCEGHGDLKPEHICLGHPPVVFDCIEFDRDFRVNDVLDEMSFLALECKMLGYGDLGESLLGDVLGDLDGSSRAHPFYLTYRACVRAKVEAMKAELAGHDSRGHQELCQKYLGFANQVSDQLGQPRLFTIGGLMGSGKTTLATALGEHIGALHLESDRCRKEIFTDHENQSFSYGQGIYQPKARDHVYFEVLSLAQKELKLGRSVIADASFISKEHRFLFRSLAQELGVPYHMIWCSCPADLAKQRISRRLSMGDSPSDARVDLYELQSDNWEPCGPDEANLELDGSAKVEDNLARIQARLGV